MQVQFHFDPTCPRAHRTAPSMRASTGDSFRPHLDARSWRTVDDPAR